MLISLNTIDIRQLSWVELCMVYIKKIHLEIISRWTHSSTNKVSNCLLTTEDDTIVSFWPNHVCQYISSVLLCIDIPVDVHLKEFDLLHHLNLDGWQQGSMFSVKLDASWISCWSNAYTILCSLSTHESPS